MPQPEIKVLIVDLDSESEGIVFDGFAGLADAIVVVHEALVFGAAMGRPQMALVLYDDRPVLGAILNPDGTIACRYHTPTVGEEMKSIQREETL